ncbi:GLPGLI family protein [Winogradskyella eckloniae]|uniref:GLPGLI family protein n=1 Tax=Winogradskyella eckloniae TaxID=1089306 RepID=UPI0015631E40|nr:GLPGLI family protein [Winogradskyella eckloniae]NRD18543.1 GLPGLI family protein [Winogradskyella eckloniae]
MKLNLAIIVFFSFQLFFLQEKKDTGYIIYQVSVTESFTYNDLIKDDKEYHNKQLYRDSIMNSLELGVAFSDNKSQSFRLKDYSKDSQESKAMYKAKGKADYSYDAKSNVAITSMEYWYKQLAVIVDLKDKWEIDFKKTKTIDGYKCYYAKYLGENVWWDYGSDKPTYAWFTTEIPMPYGPLYFNGLPGLIIEMNVENVRYTAKKISFEDTYENKLQPIDLSKHKQYTDEEFISSREDIKRDAKRIMLGN